MNFDKRYAILVLSAVFMFCLLVDFTRFGTRRTFEFSETSIVDHFAGVLPIVCSDDHPIEKYALRKEALLRRFKEQQIPIVDTISGNCTAHADGDLSIDRMRVTDAHIGALKKVRNNKQWYMILEDDVGEFDVSKVRKLIESLVRHQPTVDSVNLYCPPSGASCPYTYLFGTRATAYLVDFNGAQRMLNILYDYNDYCRSPKAKAAGVTCRAQDSVWHDDPRLVWKSLAFARLIVPSDVTTEVTEEWDIHKVDDCLSGGNIRRKLQTWIYYEHKFGFLR